MKQKLMKGLAINKLLDHKRTAALIAIMLPLALLFIYVVVRSGPLAPTLVTQIQVSKVSISPALFGIGTVEARYQYKVGPTIPGRVQTLKVDIGDQVTKGQLLGVMDSVDLEQRMEAQQSALMQAKAKLQEAQTRYQFSDEQFKRYQKLLESNSISEEQFLVKQQDYHIAEAGLAAARQELLRQEAEQKAMQAQQHNLDLISPIDGIVVKRNAEQGTTVVAGQSVIEIINPEDIWINVRFDQIHSTGLNPGLTALVNLRSKSKLDLSGKIYRVEPIADAVTEEFLAKVTIDELPQPLPSIGELAEVTIELDSLPSTTVIPNAALKRIDGELGVWKIIDGDIEYVPVSIGATDLDGLVEIKKGLSLGESVVLHSEKALTANSRIKVVESLVGKDK
ncbi:efflux RND transporter periplasmic adaptor subunit [Kangiella aquimarina]|uniref:Efflux RND transporter periplasmic adaptor subunit n=1 Tax=Kangiella aquimarina TaxID=261965 RepID=A0ABZ0X708_9GAMM|nr:efflux RND transporter periplasmic adaptor subunit [Kangiella aquimarina]WQG86186.1 efflux RND transporter periplasmic adaptor subunit [Kangiella aquimarina]